MILLSFFGPEVNGYACRKEALDGAGQKRITPRDSLRREANGSTEFTRTPTEVRRALVKLDAAKA